MGKWLRAQHDPVRATLHTARPARSPWYEAAFAPPMRPLAGMGPAWMCARADLRRRWKSAVAIALLIGVAGAVVLCAYAGGRRTDSAYPRYLAATHAADLLVATESSGPSFTNRFYKQVEALPEVRRSGIVLGPSLVYVFPNGQPDLSNETYVQVYASEDGRAGYQVGGFKVLAGRVPRPDRPFEALANRTLAIRQHLHVGSRFPMYPVNTNGSVAEQLRTVHRERPVVFTITGIGVSYDEVVPVAPNDGFSTLFVTPAYFQAHHAPAETNFDGVFVQLRADRSRSVFEQATSRTWDADSAKYRLGALYIADLTLHHARAERAIHPEALALELFALFVALGAVLAVGQVLVREIRLSSTDHGTLSALGFDRRQLVAGTLSWLLLPVLAGAGLAVIGAVAASPLMPIGPARIAEPAPGVSVDFLVLGVGLAALIIIFGGISSVAAWSASRNRVPDRDGASPKAARRWSGAEAFGRAGFSPSAEVGLDMAFTSGRGSAAVPVRSALLGAVVAVAAVVSALTFAANLDRLVSTPYLYGVTWNAGIDAQFSDVTRPQVMAVVKHLPGVTGAAAGTYGDDVAIDGRSVPAVGIDSLKGSLFPTILTGRRPIRSNEVALGAGTMRQLSTHVGGWVTLSSNTGPERLKVVGEAVFPSFGRGSFTPTDLGEGAVTTAAVVAKPPAGAGAYNFVVMRFNAASRQRDVQALAQVAHQAGCPADQCLMTTQRLLPTDVESYNRVSLIPVYLAGLLGVFGAAMVGHALATSVRRRRRDLALLKTLGLTTRQVAGAVAWQASAFAFVGVVFGVPAGWALGHWLWSLFASEIGIPATSVIPLEVLLVVPAVVVLANIIAALPGRSAARTRVAIVLKTE
jgi:FtsX-like permease family